ncbi:hypothetical protein [Microbulbifer aggregans]|uniref:hypothetical protein n=1 Tax=Microbulbifer aggregans TaxID=1769779 RepID=UPI001CFDEC76|nr:hypothetical protein [Microbulbifer aggregans]
MDLWPAVRDRIVKAVRRVIGNPDTPVLFYLVTHDTKGMKEKRFGEKNYEDRPRVSPHFHGAISLPVSAGPDLVKALEREITREVAAEYPGRGASRAVLISSTYTPKGSEQKYPIDRGWLNYMFYNPGYLGGHTFISQDLKRETKTLWSQLREAGN